MTLVIGLKTSRSITFLSDTRVSDPNATGPEVIPGRLKLIILRPDLCVGYAGRANLAIDVIQNLSKQNLEFGDAAAVLAEATARGDVDFMVGGHDPIRLIRISNGGITQVDDEDWIGDDDAAEVYANECLKVRKIPGTAPDDARRAAAFTGFRVVMQDLKITTVDGLEIHALLYPDGFRYPYSANVFMPPQQVGQIPTVLEFGDAAKGGFGYTLLTPDAPGIGVVAVHILQARLGFVYAPLVDGPIPEMVPDVSHDELRVHVLNRLKVSVQGLILS